MQPLCRGHERFYLLQFKDSFIINKSASLEPWAYPKVASWTLEGNNDDCCSWDGVECDEFTGHVIGLDLNSSCLYGSINSTSSLFHLVHLQRLNLADNHFKLSQIPSTISNLSKLTYLDLSFSVFASQIPLEVSQLSQLSSLNLSRNSLEIKKPSLRSLVENLISLEKLDLSGVKIISMVPTILANLSSLTSLRFRNCGFCGEFPVGIFKLPNLRVLDVRYNDGLTGHLPDFQWSSNLEIMDLAVTSFSGKLPASIGNLGSLTTILIWDCNFSGFIPSTLGNLTRLNSLDLSHNTYEGHIPSSFGNLVQLSFLYLNNNEFLGPIPFVLANLTQLTALVLDHNKFAGQIPSSIFNLTNLEFLSLSNNYFSGIVEFDKFVKLKKLTTLDLSYNQVSFLEGSLPIPSSSTLQYHASHNSFIGKISELICNLSSLQVLELSENNLSGPLPQCMHSFGDSLVLLDIRRNKFEGSIPQTWANGSKLMIIDFSQNKFQGWLPRSLSKCIALKALDLSNNQFNDTFPSWLGNLSNLKILILRSNKFYGPIKIHSVQEIFTALDFSSNRFAGDIPESIGNIKVLHLLNLSNNMLTGCIPPTLGNLAELESLDLSQNKLIGEIPQQLLTFLESFNVSHNDLIRVHDICTAALIYHHPSHIIVPYPEANLTDLPKHSIYSLRCCRAGLPEVIPPRLVVVNLLGSLPLSILRENGDLESWCNALLIASLPKPLEGRFLRLRTGRSSSSPEDTELVGEHDLEL
ncbi:hypothetical protein ACB092_12G106800 [Castanea dentata]